MNQCFGEEWIISTFDWSIPTSIMHSRFTMHRHQTSILCHRQTNMLTDNSQPHRQPYYCSIAHEMMTHTRALARADRHARMHARTHGFTGHRKYSVSKTDIIHTFCSIHHLLHFYKRYVFSKYVLFFTNYFLLIFYIYNHYFINNLF